MYITTNTTIHAIEIPARFGDDHLGAKLVEFVPQLFGLQTAANRRHLAVSDVISGTRHLLSQTVVVRV